MILCNLSLEMEDLVEPTFVNEIIDKVLKEVTEVFYDEETGFLYENVLPDGSLSDSFEGRLINPGHGIEAMWFVMDLARARGNQKLVEKALSIALSTLEHSWDKKYGGIFYFMDSKGYPPQQLEWDQKLWWVHLETLVCLAKGYEYTGNPDAKRWFIKVQDYTWSHFKDYEYGEWFGYLKRNGEILMPLKGGKWKGCFHVPRALFLTWKSLESMSQTSIAEKTSDIKKH
jgi:N-acylglucosamine 2-epimerase